MRLNRRQFLQVLGTWPWMAGSSAPLSPPAQAAGPQTALRIALVADAHLTGTGRPNDNTTRLLEVIQEINACDPPVDLLIFAGDLTADGELASLELGRELLKQSKCPALPLPGETDCQGAGLTRWFRLFGPPRFAFSWHHCHFLGCDLEPPASQGSFRLEAERRRWLQERLRGLPPDEPLFLITHAPLYRLYRPWGWWTDGSEALWPRLAARSRTYLLHGHVHQPLLLTQGPFCFQGLAPICWSYPDPRQGVSAPAGQGMPAAAGGCGWQLLEVAAGGAVRLQLRLRDPAPTDALGS